MAMLAFGCGTTLSELDDSRNSVSIHPTTWHLQTQDTKWEFHLPESKVAVVGTMAAIHAVLYLPFRGPCKMLFGIIYNRAMDFSIVLSAGAKNILMGMINADGADADPE